MSQSLSLVMSQELRQEQRLTPQLIQSMDILQLPLMALEARINEEMEQNPVLEVAPPAPDEEAPPRPAPTEPTNGPESAAEAVGFQRLERMSREYDFDPGDHGYGRARSTGERDAKMDAMANTASRPVSLREHLSGQWTFVDVDAEVKRAGEALLDYIEEDGYLRTDLETVAQSVRPPPSSQTWSRRH